MKGLFEGKPNTVLTPSQGFFGYYFLINFSGMYLVHKYVFSKQNE